MTRETVGTADLIAGVADRLFDAIERGDADALAALWSDDIVVWRQGGGPERDKPRGLKVIAWFVGATAERRYEVLDRRYFDGGFVQQHVLRATRISDGGRVALPTCVVIECPDGLITRLDGWFDSVAQAELAKG